MGRAKDIRVKVIPAKIANDFVRKHHYSGMVAPTSKIHFGAFLDGRLHGVLQFGNPISKRRMLGLVNDTKWNEMLELNRMAFDEYLPKNSESRCISICMKLIKKNAGHIKWIVSFADGTQCGDGVIYRASGFYLTQIKENKSIIKLPDGKIIHRMSLNMGCVPLVAKKYNPKNLTVSNAIKELNAEILAGFQIRYIYLIDKSCKITVPILPFSKIDEMNAGMYKGEKRLQADAHKRGSGDQLEKGGANPTHPLHI
jgi:hypothetical protein